MNLYRGCSHNCAYCDGRSEAYRVAGDFARDIVYKENALEILQRELDPRRRRKSFRPGYVFLGGGVSDSWQPAEREVGLTREVLKLFRIFPYPLLLLTKSDLILRDLDLLKELGTETRITVAVSLSSMDEKISRILEPGASTPAQRLEVVRQARSSGLGAGVMLLPVVPLITDRPEMLDQVFRSSKAAGAEFVIPGLMTLKPGRQHDHFISSAEPYFPSELSKYDQVYGTIPDRWGNPTAGYYSFFGSLVDEISRSFQLPRRIPEHLFPGNITAVERAVVMLDQMHGILRDQGLASTFGKASRLMAAAVAEDGGYDTGKLSGIDPSTGRIIRDILETGTSPVYRRILIGGNPSG